MKVFRILCFSLFFASCGPVIYYDFESSTNFSNYQTYNYFDDMKTGLSEFDTKRIIRAIDSHLKAKGYERVTNADFYIDIQSQKLVSRTSSNVGVAIGGTGGNVGGGMSVGVPVNTNQFTREIVIEFVDIANDIMFWQAIAESSYRPDATPEKREIYFMDLVERIFSEYPPKSQN